MASFIRVRGFLVILLTWIAACGEDNPVTPPVIDGLPPNFRLTGNATGADAGGLTALDLVFELSSETSRTANRVDYQGVHGGGVERSVLARDGSAFAFAADVFGEVEVYLFVAGSIDIRIPVNETAEGRFWRNLARFTGTVDGSGRGQGRWTCAPFDIDTGGYVNESGRVVEAGSPAVL